MRWKCYISIEGKLGVVIDELRAYVIEDERL